MNGGISYLGVDLSQTSLSAGEAAAVAWAFSEGRDAQLVQGTYEELVEQGYITGEPLEESDAVFWEWKDGILFSITETDEPVTFNLPAMGVDDGGSADMSQFNVSDTVSFDAQKWRSGLGAYIFSGCTAVRNNAGHWGRLHCGQRNDLLKRGGRTALPLPLRISTRHRTPDQLQRKLDEVCCTSG